MAGETELNILLKDMSPNLRDGEFVFLTFSGKDYKYGDYGDLEPICFFQEEEGITLVVPKEIAVDRNLSFEDVFKSVTLTIHSSLNAVGLTGAFATKLASDGISANVVAGYYHDHIFVPTKDSERAISSLQELARSAKVEYAYNLNAAQYTTTVSSNKDYRSQIKKFASMLSEKSSVLDLGCGPGINSQIMIDAGHIVTGLDASVSMVELAKKNCLMGTFERGSVLDYRASGQYDAVILSFIIVHLNNNEKSKLFKNLVEMIVPGGKLYISYMIGRKPGWETTSFSDDPIFFNYYDKDKISGELLTLGFYQIDEKTIPYKETDGLFTNEIFQIYQSKSLK